MDTPAPARRRPHPLDLLVLVLALVFAAIAYTFLFKRSPVPTPIDKFLGAELVVVFPGTPHWKSSFPDGDRIVIDHTLVGTVVERSHVMQDLPRLLRMRLRILERSDQRPELDRRLRRGTEVHLHDEISEVTAEIEEIRWPSEAE